MGAGLAVFRCGAKDKTNPLHVKALGLESSFQKWSQGSIGGMSGGSDGEQGGGSDGGEGSGSDGDGGGSACGSDDEGGGSDGSEDGGCANCMNRVGGCVCRQVHNLKKGDKIEKS